MAAPNDVDASNLHTAKRSGPRPRDTFTSLALIAFAYISGITTVAGAVFGGLIFAGGLVSYALQEWLGIQGEWFSLAAAVLLVVMLIQPQGVATAVIYREGRRPRSVTFRAPSPAEGNALTEAIDEAGVTS